MRGFWRHIWQVGVVAHVLVGLDQAMLGLRHYLPLLIPLVLPPLSGSGPDILLPPDQPCLPLVVLFRHWNSSQSRWNCSQVMVGCSLRATSHHSNCCLLYT